jgi:hypothetical protein
MVPRVDILMGGKACILGEICMLVVVSIIAVLEFRSKFIIAVQVDYFDVP